MRTFSSLAIRPKLMLIIMAASCAAVSLTVGAMIIYEVTSFRQVILQDLSTQAQMIGETCAAALDFDDSQTAKETLTALRARPDIVMAGVYRRNRTVLAEYRVESGPPQPPILHKNPGLHKLPGGHWALFQRIERKGELVGMVYLCSNPQTHYWRLTVGISVALGAMAIATLAAFVLAARLQQVISRPIVDLTRVAEQIRASQDYSLRACPNGPSEIGLLTKGFNRMLETIQERDSRLRVLTGQLLSAQDEERRRIGRELHDVTGQNLAALEISLSKLNEFALKDDSERRLLITQSLSLVDQCSAEVRTLSYLLHPPLLEEFGLADAMRWYVDGFSARTGIAVNMDLPKFERFSPEAEIALFRVLQESLGNIHRHSDSAAAKIGISHDNGRIVMDIQDTGKGFSSLKGESPYGTSVGLGILSMRERLKQLGGELLLESGPSGTRVRAVLPVNGGVK